MTTRLKLRRGSTSEHASFTGAVGEVTVDTTKKTAVVHDGATAGGFPLALERNSEKTLALFGAVGDGITDDSAALQAWVDSSDPVIHLNRQYRIANNITIPHTKTVVFQPNSGFVIDNTKAITLNGQIDAGDFQIFFGAGDVLASNNNMGSGFYPIRTPIVKAIWFGVIPDALYPTTSTPDPVLTSVTIGQTPSGTDSTRALKSAVRYCQLLNLSAGAFVYTMTAPTLHLPPGQVYVKGHNIMGNQILTSYVEGWYAIADAGGVAQSSPSWNTYAGYSYNFNVEGNDCQILWKVENEYDIFWDSSFLPNRIVARDFHVAPIVSTDLHGIFFRNKAITTFGTKNNYANNLGPAIFDNVNVTMNILGGNTSANFFEYRLKRMFWNEGNARCDNFTVREGFYNGFGVFWKGDNPEAVDLRFENNMIQADKENTTFFEFTSFYDGFIAIGNFFSFKANNITLLAEYNATSQYVGSSYYSNNRYYFPAGNRYEFVVGLTGIIIYRGYASLAIFEGLNIGLGGLPADATDAIIDHDASVIFRDSFCSGKFQITKDARTSVSGANPKITYDNSPAFLYGALSGYQVQDDSNVYQVYRNAVANIPGGAPVVRYLNQPGSNTTLPLPEHYGTLPTFLTPTKVKLVDRSIDAQSRYGTGNSVFLLPPMVKIKSIKLFTKSGTFNNLNLFFGGGAGGTATYTLNTTLTGSAQNGLELIPAGKCLLCPTVIQEYLKLNVLVYNGATPLAGGWYGWLELEYEPITDAQTLNPVLGNDVVALVDAV